MATIYNFHQDAPALLAGLALEDKLLVYDASTGRTKTGSGEDLADFISDRAQSRTLKYFRDGAGLGNETYDTQALENFIASGEAAVDVDPVEFLIEAGTYTLAAGTRMRGVRGVSALRVRDTLFAAQMLKPAGARISLRDLILRGPQDTVSAYLAGQNAVENDDDDVDLDYFRMLGCEVYGWADVGALIYRGQNAKIHHCHFHNLGRMGCMFGAGDDTEFCFNLVDTIGPGSGGSAPLINAYGVVHSNDGLDASTPPTRNALVAFNTIRNIPTWEAIDFHGIDSARVIGNWIEDCCIGVYYGPSSGTNDDLPVRGIISGNHFYTTATYRRAAILVAGTDASNTVKGVDVADNIIRGHGLNQGLYDAGIGINDEGAIHVVYAEDVSVNNNRIKDWNQRAILFRRNAVGCRAAGNTIGDGTAANSICIGIDVMESSNTQVLIEPNVIQGGGTETAFRATGSTPSGIYGATLMPQKVSGVSTLIASGSAALLHQETIAVPSQAATVEAALEYLGDMVHVNGIPTIQVTGHVTVAGDIGDVKTTASGRARLRGTPALDRNLTSIVSVTGSAGAWVVTVAMDSTASMSIGDVVLVRNVVPGIHEPGVSSGRPAFGQVDLGLFTMGEVTTVGTAATLSGSDGTTYLGNGDVVCIGGEIRTVSGVGASAFTLSSALAADVTGKQYWWHMRAATGTVSTAGSSTTLTGSGTSFTTQVNIGDLIFIVGAGVRRVSSITNNTTLVMSSAITASSGAFGVMTTGECHEGAWVVTDVPVANGGSLSAGQVRWTNRGRTAQGQPPVNNVTAGDVLVLTSVLTSTAGDGITISQGEFDIDDIAIVGGTTTTLIGIDLRGTDGVSAGRVKLGDHVGIVGFGYSVRGSSGSVLRADDAYFSGAATRGLDLADGAKAVINGATVSGCVGNGVFVGVGSNARASDVRVIGNSLQGIRKEVGGHGWFDFAYSIANGGDGYLDVGGAMTHLVGMRLLKNTGAGWDGQNGGYGRGTGALILCNTSNGVTMAGGVMEFGQAWAGGNAADGFNAARSSLSLDDGASTYNVSDGIQGNRQLNVSAERVAFVGNTSAQVRADDHSKFWLAASTYATEGASGIVATDWAEVWVEGYSGTPTLNLTVNVAGSDGAIIRDG